jgi:hypothetical protein
MSPYREGIEARFCKIESDIARLEKTPKEPVKSSLNWMITRNQAIVIVIVVILTFTLCTTCGILLAIGHNEPIEKGIGFSMFISIIISVIAIVFIPVNVNDEGERR